MCECELKLIGDPRIKLTAMSNYISLQQTILKIIKEKDSHCFESGTFVSNLCNSNKCVGKHSVQLPEVVPFPIMPAHDSPVGFGQISLQLMNISVHLKGAFFSLFDLCGLAVLLAEAVFAYYGIYPPAQVN